MKNRWYLNSILIFIFALLAIGTSLTIYITSYIKVNHTFQDFVKLHGLDSSILLEKSTSLNILILSILCALIIISITIIFTYYRKVIQLYRMQQNFIHGFTHELKTPVTSIKLYLDTIKMHDLDRETLLKYVGFMQQDTNRLTDNISNILNLAQIEDNKYMIDYSLIEVVNFISEKIKKNSHIFEHATIETSGSNTIFIRADKALFETLMMNLLVNAIIYTDKTTPTVKVLVDKNDNYISIDVKDDGIGISKKDKQKILKQFYRVKRAVKGSGLGLYLVSQIVKLHKWKLEVKSEGLGQGSSFKIMIPINLNNTRMVPNENFNR